MVIKIKEVKALTQKEKDELVRKEIANMTKEQRKRYLLIKSGKIVKR